VHGLRSLLDSLGDAFALGGDNDVYRIGLWLLAGVFTWSGVAKVRNPAVAALALVDFRLVETPRRGLGRAVGIAELALAALLGVSAIVGRPLAAVPLAAALVLLAFFCALIGRSLLAGEQFPCACFGNAESTLSRLTLLRTGSLALLALVLLAAAPTGSAAVAADDVALQLVTAAALLAVLVHAAQAVHLIRGTRSLLRPEVPEG
jgi:hypothetical protein